MNTDHSRSLGAEPFSFGIKPTQADFVTGIHPRLHVWSADAPEGILDRGRLRERIRNGDAYIRAKWERIMRTACEAVDQGPIVAVPTTMSADPARTLRRVYSLGLAF
jgi:hypothetical protein